MDHMLEKQLLLLGDIWDLKNSKKIYLAHKIFFILRSLSLRRTILSPSIIVQQKIF
jgi:hypothetical protein